MQPPTRVHRRSRSTHWRPIHGLRALMAGAVIALTPAGAATPAPAPAAAPLMLGVQNGLANESQLAMDNAAQALADLIGGTAGRSVLWKAHFTAKDAVPSPAETRYDFAFVKPPNLVALLLAKGWTLVATAKDPFGFGTDFIAQPCPGHPGQVLLGGPSMAILNVAELGPARCVAVDKVWTATDAVLLVPAKGSLVDKMATRLWREHGAAMPRVVHVDTQNAVTGLMRDMHVSAIGVVTPLVSKPWVANGGVLLQHAPMPFWAMLAAPGTSPDLIAKVRAALTGPAAAHADKALHIPGWQAGDAKPYLAFQQWLEAK